MFAENRSRLRPLLLAVLAPLALLLSGCGGPNLVERLTSPYWGCGGTIVVVLDIVALVDLLGDDARDTSSKVIWALLIIFFPIIGVILYFLFGSD